MGGAETLACGGSSASLYVLEEVFSCGEDGVFNNDCKNWNKPKGSMRKSLQKYKKS
jgi:hypothetical protein